VNRRSNSEYQSSKGSAQALPCAFTLIEVVASLLLLAILFSGILVAFTRSMDRALLHRLDERAVAVAQRRIEMLLASRQVPESSQLQGRDEIDPLFIWQLSLERVPVGGNRATENLSNTVIKAVVKVTHEGDLRPDAAALEMVRYFAVLKPPAGRPTAVPTSYDSQDPLWYLQLQSKLGREPTVEETFAEMAKQGLLPAGVIELIESDDWKE